MGAIVLEIGAPEPANDAAANDAMRYWPSMPMLNSPMRKPIAAATAAV